MDDNMKLKTSLYKVFDNIKDIGYGFYDKNTGKLINDRQWIYDCDNLNDYYSVQYDPEKTITNKWGICQDQSIAIKYLFNKYYPDIPVQLYSMRMGRFGHCVPTFKYNDVWYYLENAWDKEMGVHGPFDNEDAVREYLKNLYIKHHGEETTEVPIVDTYEIKEPIQESFIELLETRSNDKVSGVSDENEEVETKTYENKSDNAVSKQKVATRSNSRTRSVVTDIEDSKVSDISNRPNKPLIKKFKNEQKIAEVTIKSPNSKKPIIGRSSTAADSESHYTRTNDSVEYNHTYDKNDPRNSDDALRRKAGKAAMKEYNKQSSDKREQEQHWRMVDKYGFEKANKFANYKLKKKSLSENYDLDEYTIEQFLEDNGYEVSDENLKILHEVFHNYKLLAKLFKGNDDNSENRRMVSKLGTRKRIKRKTAESNEVVNESYSEYELMCILDENGFTTTDEDVALLRESLENGTVIIETEE